MTEREYIDATNLAKIRAARMILHDILTMTREEKFFLGKAFDGLRAYEDLLTEAVHVTTKDQS